jgi:3-methyladenine DNA glycosylase Tag
VPGTVKGLVTTFARIEALSVKRKGGSAAMEKLLPKPRSAAALAKIPDDVFLSAMAKAIFRAGFVWKIVDYKWPGMEEAFAGFDPELVAGFGERELDELLADPRVIRHREKIASVRENASWMLRIAGRSGSFGAFLAKWPAENIVDLWAELREHASRLGGNTGPFFLREVGKDTFLLTADVVKALRREKIVTGDPASKRNLAAAQEAFNGWHEETGRPLCQLSRILSFSVV